MFFWLVKYLAVIKWKMNGLAYLWNRGLMSSSLSGTISSSSTSPLSKIMSISEYFIPLTSTGINLGRWGCRASLQTGSSAKLSQNSQASRLTPSSASWKIPRHIFLKLMLWTVSNKIFHYYCKSQKANTLDKTKTERRRNYWHFRYILGR